MSRRLSDDRLGAMHLQLSNAIRKQDRSQWLDYRGVAIVEGHDLICALDELRRRRQGDGKKGAFELAPVTKQLMAMKPGDVLILPPMAMTALTSNRATARKKLRNPLARWQGQVMNDNRVRVERLEDGAEYHYGRPKNPAVAMLANMKIGEAITFEGKMYAGLKQQARRRLGLVEADWRCENLANGKTRARRIQ